MYTKDCNELASCTLYSWMLYFVACNGTESFCKSPLAFPKSQTTCDQLTFAASLLSISANRFNPLKFLFRIRPSSFLEIRYFSVVVDSGISVTPPDDVPLPTAPDCTTTAGCGVEYQENKFDGLQLQFLLSPHRLLDHRVGEAVPEHLVDFRQR